MNAMTKKYIAGSVRQKSTSAREMVEEEDAALYGLVDAEALLSSGERMLALESRISFCRSPLLPRCSLEE